ncbi:MAG: hypothetical protein PUF13_11355 [Lachnospiraceae bacterium]|nr:hypothetical protein [Lachnospiraceae bacterium]
MRKSSKHSGEITESCRWWDCSMEQFAEWTFEGGLKSGFSVWFVVRSVQGSGRLFTG